MAAPMLEQSVKPNIFPVITKQKAAIVNSNPTELLYSRYSDRLFIIVTQYQKIGTLVNVTKDTVLDETGSRTPVYSTKVLLGKDEPLTHVIAKNLVADLEITKPVLISFALKDNSSKTVKAINELLSTLATSK